ncbi:unnamed protein product [Adineta steineri]|uniref:Uncharacterized protein n=1 Tax=Adineta steineri TaxID=433720 RepID=A0A820DRX4_9BILA|nr:unnamed protein product [Adineta steineri]CAF4236925.1 unnamed protein product [Adineta steineri]
MRAPFEGFLLNKDTGRPTLQLGMTINISLSLETSEEDLIPRDWSSDTGATIHQILLILGFLSKNLLNFH